MVEGSEVPKINVLVNLVLQSKGVELTKLVDEPTNISFTIKLIWMQLSPVEFLVHLEKIYIKTCYIPLERLESQDLEIQQGLFCKVGQNILQTRI